MIRDTFEQEDPLLVPCSRFIFQSLLMTLLKVSESLDCILHWVAFHAKQKQCTDNVIFVRIAKILSDSSCFFKVLSSSEIKA